MDIDSLITSFQECVVSPSAAELCSQQIGTIYPETLKCPNVACSPCQSCPSCQKRFTEKTIVENGVTRKETSLTMEEVQIDPTLTSLLVKDGKVHGGYTPKSADLVAFRVPIDVPSYGFPPGLLAPDPLVTASMEQITPALKAVSTFPIPKSNEIKTSDGVSIWYLTQEKQDDLLNEWAQLQSVTPPCTPGYYFDPVAKVCFLVRATASALKADAEREEKRARLVYEEDAKKGSMRWWLLGVANLAGTGTRFSKPILIEDTPMIPAELTFNQFVEPTDADAQKNLIRHYKTATILTQTYPAANKKNKTFDLTVTDSKDINEDQSILIDVQETKGIPIQGKPPCSGTMNIWLNGQCTEMTEVYRAHFDNMSNLDQYVFHMGTTNEGFVVKAYWNPDGYFVVPKQPILIPSGASLGAVSQQKVMLNRQGQRHLNALVDRAQKRKPGVVKGAVVTASTTSAKAELRSFVDARLALSKKSHTNRKEQKPKKKT